MTVSGSPFSLFGLRPDDLPTISTRDHDQNFCIDAPADSWWSLKQDARGMTGSSPLKFDSPNKYRYLHLYNNLIIIIIFNFYLWHISSLYQNIWILTLFMYHNRQMFDQNWKSMENKQRSNSSVNWYADYKNLKTLSVLDKTMKTLYLNLIEKFWI